MTFVSPSLGLLAPDGGRVSSFPFQGQDAAATVKKCWALCSQLAVSWPVDLGNCGAGQREDISISSFESLAFSLPLLFQENLLQDLSSSGCLITREQRMPCVLGWESLAATLSTWVWGWSLACAGECVCVYVCVCVCVPVWGVLRGLNFYSFLVFWRHTF